MNTARYIDSPEKLQTMLQDMAGAAWIAIDTEFQREKTYFAKLCLIQIGTPNHVALIDPLTLDDLQPLLDWLYRPDLLKVFHAARQDQELFYDMTGQPLPNVFDTQLAAPLLGHPEQAGYARLVQDILGVNLKKGHSRTDWTRRPLSDDQLAYAADDVIYLAQLYPMLHDQLEAKDRTSWLQKDLDTLSDPALYANDPAKAWKRIRAARHLKGASLSIVQALASWREQQARRKNIPRGWLMKDDVIIDLAKQKPGSTEQLVHIRGMNDSQKKKLASQILPIIEEAAQAEPAPLKNKAKPSPASPKEEALVDYLMACVRLRCAEADMNPNTVTNRNELIKLIKGERQLDILSGWQAPLVGDELVRLLEGKSTLSVHAQSLQITEAP